jgi:hypothetical protein
MIDVSTTQFVRDFIGGRKITEPMRLTYYGEPIADIYPVQDKFVGRVVEKQEDGNVKVQNLYEISPKEAKVPEAKPSHRGQCQSCFQFRDLLYSLVQGENGINGRWVCMECLNIVGEKKEETRPKEMVSRKDYATFN